MNKIFAESPICEGKILDAFKVIGKRRFFVKFECDNCKEIYSLTILEPTGQYEIWCPKCRYVIKFELTGNPSSRLNVFQEHKITHHLGYIEKYRNKDVAYSQTRKG